MVRDALDRWCERGILGLVLAMLVFGPLALGAVRELSFTVIAGLTVGSAALWGARLWLEPRPQLLWPPLCWVVLAFAAYAIARYFTADIEYVARQELFRVLVYAFLFFAILNNLRRQEFAQIDQLHADLSGDGDLFLRGLSVRDQLGPCLALRSNPTRIRVRAPTFARTTWAVFLKCSCRLGLAYSLTGRIKAADENSFGYAGLVILAGIAVTVSRGSWVSSALSPGCCFSACWCSIVPTGFRQWYCWWHRGRGGLCSSQELRCPVPG